MRSGRYLLLLLLVSCAPHQVDLMAQGPATWGDEPGGFERATVTRVVDGDTVEVEITGRSRGPGAGLARVGEVHKVR
ncbi:MAG: hypothetical protein ACLGHL_02190, partial [Actinomycetota bacterium]